MLPNTERPQITRVPYLSSKGQRIPICKPHKSRHIARTIAIVQVQPDTTDSASDSHQVFRLITTTYAMQTVLVNKFGNSTKSSLRAVRGRIWQLTLVV